MAGKHRKPDPARTLIPTAAGATAAALMLTTTGTLPAIRVPVTEAAVITHPEHRVPRRRPAMMLAPPLLAPASVELAPGPPRVLRQWTPALAVRPPATLVAQPVTVVQPQPQRRQQPRHARPERPAIPLQRAETEPKHAAPTLDVAAKAVDAAVSRVGDRYVWGGTTPGGFDCSGLVQWAYQQAGIRLPRTAADQANAGRLVGIQDARPGDLALYYHPIEHVAMIVGRDANGVLQIVEAPTFGVPVHVRPLYADGLVEIKRPTE